MADVERIRKAAERRISQGRVGMVLTCRQILDLIERGDMRQGSPPFSESVRRKAFLSVWAEEE